MKKRLLFVAAIFAATATFAQDGLTSKKGEAYLPEAGDWAIGIDANPFLNYAGNLFNGNTGNGIGAGATWYMPNTIYGKMFKDEKTAYIGMLRIGFGSNSATNNIDTTGALGATGTITDEVSVSYNNITLGGGIEKRRGNTRIQGVYGAMMYIGFGGGSTKYTYGDTRNDGHTAQWTNWSGTTAVGTSSGNGVRNTEVKAGSTFQLGLMGFLGAEWFFAPKVSLGAKYTWGLAMSSTGESETTSEEWTTPAGGTANTLVTKTTKGGKSSAFSLDNGISGANISLNIHF
ncbi:MAG: hypothetical protein H6589_10080 [Flavobacteriales bacterium]|nr:hypothetical protein [Flavobacteriales bacterium]